MYYYDHTIISSDGAPGFLSPALSPVVDYQSNRRRGDLPEGQTPHPPRGEGGEGGVLFLSKTI